MSYDPKFYYSKSWRIFRADFIAQHPICSVPGCGLPTKQLDHIVKRSVAPERAFDPTNINHLCVQHHARKTRVHDQLGKTGDYNHTLPGCDRDGSPIDPQHHWNKL